MMSSTGRQKKPPPTTVIKDISGRGLVALNPTMIPNGPISKRKRNMHVAVELEKASMGKATKELQKVDVDKNRNWNYMK